GRDRPPRGALGLLPRVPGRMATIHGRYYAMDRDKRWDRIERSYRAIVDADGPRVDRAEDAVRECYARAACRDELLEPHVVGEGEPIRDRDAVIFFNFRPDRARQLTWALMRPDFDGFARRRLPRDLTFVTLTEYQVGLPNVRVAFSPGEVVPMAQLLADAGLRQFHTAETEKYAHVTYFFNGGREEPFAGEDRELVPSQKVATYDLEPEMSAAGVAWSVYLALGAALAGYAVVTWLGALVARAPVLYGEGAVANAARLARDGIAYLDVDPQRFVAANYPPLYLHVASLGDPFVVGRIASIVSTLGVAGLVFVSARSARRVFAAALALGCLA